MILLVASANVCRVSAISQELGQHLLKKEFEAFVSRFAKKYTAGTDEFAHRSVSCSSSCSCAFFKCGQHRNYIWIVTSFFRLSVFTENLEHAVELNAKLEAQGLDPIHGVTPYSDMTTFEFQDTMLMKDIEPFHLRNTSRIPLAQLSSKASEANQFDWREKGIVTPVKVHIIVFISYNPISSHSQMFLFSGPRPLWFMLGILCNRGKNRLICTSHLFCWPI